VVSLILLIYINSISTTTTKVINLPSSSGPIITNKSPVSTPIRSSAPISSTPVVTILSLDLIYSASNGLSANYQLTASNNVSNYSCTLVANTPTINNLTPDQQGSVQTYI